jgi:tetratricopeptide (TPR) repeat protein
MPQEQGQAAAGFGIPEAAALVGWSAARVRRLVRDGVLEPTRDPRGAWRLSFRDLALLRRLRELGAQQVAPRRVRSALRRLRDESGELNALALSTRGGELVVREGDQLWSPESGQYVFDFAAAQKPSQQPVALAAAREARAPAPARDLGADEWVQLGEDLEESDPAGARAAYRAALEQGAGNADAHVNLGCLEHEAGNLAGAEAHYRAALELRPDDATARFDLAVVLEDQGRRAEARAAYEAVLARDAANAEARHNLARLCERQGDRAAALRHWVALRRLVREDD